MGGRANAGESGSAGLNTVTREEGKVTAGGTWDGHGLEGGGGGGPSPFGLLRGSGSRSTGRSQAVGNVSGVNRGSSGAPHRLRRSSIPTDRRAKQEQQHQETPTRRRRAGVEFEGKEGLKEQLQPASQIATTQQKRRRLSFGEEDPSSGPASSSERQQRVFGLPSQKGVREKREASKPLRFRDQ